MKKNITIIVSLLVSFNAYAGLAPNDPRWAVVEAFNARKQYEYARLQVQVSESQKARNDADQKKLEASKPEIGKDGIPVSAWQIKSRLKDPESVVIRSWKVTNTPFNSWILTVDFNAKNSLGGYAAIQRAEGYVKDGKWDFQILF